jgi:biopolymer transport protein TolR
MAMSTGPGAHRKAELNVTPLIDVLLVLLIIFMVILPSNSHGLNTRIPEPSDEGQQSAPAPTTDIVITVQADRMVRVNQESIAVADLAARLKTLFANASQIIFVRADKDLEFEQVAEVIDIAKGAGMNRIALMTR